MSCRLRTRCAAVAMVSLLRVVVELMVVLVLSRGGARGVKSWMVRRTRGRRLVRRVRLGGLRVRGMKDQDMEDQDKKAQSMKDQIMAQDTRDLATMLSLAVVRRETPTHCPTPALSRLPAVTARRSSHRLVPRRIPRCLGCLRQNIVFRIHQFHHTTTHQRSHQNPPPEHSRKCPPCGCLYQLREHHLMPPLPTLLLDLPDVVLRCLPLILLPRAAGGLLTILDLPPEYLSPAH
jgi:hypothetical protein